MTEWMKAIDFNNVTSLRNLNLSEAILTVLINGAQSNDAARFFAGIRRPSKQTLGLMQDLNNLRARRSELYVTDG